MIERIKLWVIRPYSIMLISALVSCTFWLLPSLTPAGKGYQETNATSFFGGVVLIFWYGAIFTTSYVGFKIGSFLAPRSRVRRRMYLLSPLYYRILVIVALIGVGFTYLSIVGKLGISSTVALSSEYSANALKATLYENYQRGVLSLRYISILAFGIGLFRFLAFREIGIWLILSFISLFANAFVSSRMSLIWTILIGVGMFVVYSGEKRRLSKRLTLGIISGTVILLVIFTVSRTYNTYRQVGIDSVFAATMGEVQRYLASPFQGAISVASNMESVHDVMDGYAISGIDTSLTTNSAFLQLYVQYQNWCFVVVCLISLFVSTIMGILYFERDNYLLVGYFVMIYPFAELWRGNIFFAGITIVLFTFSFLLPLFLNPILGIHGKRHIFR